MRELTVGAVKAVPGILSNAYHTTKVRRERRRKEVEAIDTKVWEATTIR